MASLLQTLYWNANPSNALTGIQNPGAETILRAITAAESHDASDATYVRLQTTGDGASTEGEATNDVEGALQTASAVGTIAYLRFVWRHKAAKSTGAGSVIGSTAARINGATRGVGGSTTGSFVEYAENFTTDPADASPWTNAKINAQTFGCQQYGLTDDPGVYTTNVRHDVSEFRVEVWGYLSAQAVAAAIPITNDSRSAGGTTGR